MRAGLVLIALLGCGGSSKPAPQPPQNPPPQQPEQPAQPVASGEPTAQQICKRVLELKTQRCGLFADANFDEAGCLKELAASAEDPMMKVFAGCVVQPSCEEVTNCIVAASQQVKEPQAENLRACEDATSMSPVGIAKAEWDKRNGAGVTKFSQVKSTKDKPVEMCGIAEENRWLESLQCDDGTKPVTDAEMVRAGNVGAGGRCGSIVDKYVPKCGNKSYEIFIDAYICAKP